MKYITKDKEFYLRLLQLTIPMTLASLIGFGGGLADTLMMGMLSEVHLSAVAQGNQLGFIFMLFSGGVSGAGSVMIAQYWGKGNVSAIHKILTIMYRLLIIGGILFTVIALVFSKQIMMIFATDPNVIREGAYFIRIVCFSFLISGISGGSIVALRCVGVVKIALYVSFISLLVKVLLNWILIFGNLGFPRMEIEGAAIATLLTRIIEFVMVISYLLVFDKKIMYKVRYLFKNKLDMVRDYINYGGPIFLNDFTWGIGAAILAIIIGRMGTEFTAANSIAMTLGNFTSLMAFTMAFAASTIIGNTVGSGNYEKAQVYGYTLTIISLIMGVLSSGLMIILKNPTLGLYNVSDLTMYYANQFIIIHSVNVFFQCMAMMTLVGLLRSGGDTKFVFMIDVLFMFLLAIPLSFLGGVFWGWSAALVFFTLRFDEILKVIFGLYRIKTGKYIKDVTRS